MLAELTTTYQNLRTGGLSARTIKDIAVLAMLFDHFVVVFWAGMPLVGWLLRIPGRIAAPIMCYFIAEGYYHTSSLRRYAGRLLVFALLSHFPYVIYFELSWQHATGVLWPLFLGLLALSCVKSQWPLVWRGVGVLVCCVLAYCQQFATAATLLYRLYGIPAQYVTGYVAQPADFVVDEAGGYTAILTDASAHAWVEIWLPDYGWIPVEATPAAPNSAAPTETLAGALQAVDRWQGAVDIQQSQSQNTNETASVDTLTPQSFDLATLSVWGEVMTTPLAAAILLTPLLPDGVRALRRRRLLQRGPSALLVHLLSILDRIMPDKAPVTEENLPEILTVALPALSKAEARRLVALARRAQYARPEQAPSLKDIGWALDFCRKVELQFSIRLSAGKRLWLAFLGIY